MREEKRAIGMFSDFARWRRAESAELTEDRDSMESKDEDEQKRPQPSVAVLLAAQQGSISGGRRTVEIRRENGRKLGGRLR